MERKQARSLGDVIAGVPGFKVERIATTPENGAAWQIEVRDRITHLRYTLKRPAEWAEVRAECVRQRRHMGRTNAMPEQPAAPPAHLQPAELAVPTESTPPATQEEHAVTLEETRPRTADGIHPYPLASTAAPATAPADTKPPAPGAFNVKHWEAITRSTIANAEKVVEELRAERGALDELVREAERRVRARRSEIDAAVSEHLVAIKRLRRALDVDHVERTATAPEGAPRRSSAPQTGVRAAKWGPLALEWAKTHGGVIDTALLAKQHQQYPSKFTASLLTMERHGQVERIGPGMFRVVAP